jgi:hypothetical protein
MAKEIVMNGYLPGLNSRTAWIAAIVVGIVLMIIGFATGPNWLLVGIGAAFVAIGTLFLIVAVKSRGRVN